MKAFIVGFALVAAGYSAFEFWQYLVEYWYLVAPVFYVPVGALVTRVSYLIDKYVAKDETTAYTEGGVATMVLLWPLVLVLQIVICVCMFAYLALVPGIKLVHSFVRS